MLLKMHCISGIHIGPGFAVYDFGTGEFALSHRGGDKGCQTLFIILPKSKQGLIVFTNVDDGYKVYDKLLKHYLGNYGEKIIEMDTK